MEIDLDGRASILALVRRLQQSNVVYAQRNQDQLRHLVHLTNVIDQQRELNEGVQATLREKLQSRKREIEEKSVEIEDQRRALDEKSREIDRLRRELRLRDDKINALERKVAAAVVDVVGDRSRQPNRYAQSIGSTQEPSSQSMLGSSHYDESFDGSSMLSGGLSQRQRVGYLGPLVNRELPKDAVVVPTNRSGEPGLLHRKRSGTEVDLRAAGSRWTARPRLPPAAAPPRLAVRDRVPVPPPQRLSRPNLPRMGTAAPALRTNLARKPAMRRSTSVPRHLNQDLMRNRQTYDFECLTGTGIKKSVEAEDVDDLGDTLDGVDSILTENSSVVVVESEESERAGSDGGDGSGSEDGATDENGQQAVEAQQPQEVTVFTRAHTMEQRNIADRDYCDVCSKAINRRMSFRCKDCNQTCHEECCRSLDMTICAPRQPPTKLRAISQVHQYLLEEWIPVTYHPMIPFPLVLCVDALLRDHRNVPSLYVEQSDSHNVKAKRLLTECRKQRVNPVFTGGPHVLTCFIKLFISSMQRRVISGDSIREIFEACSSRNEASIERAVSDMVPAHRDVLCILVYHWIVLLKGKNTGLKSSHIADFLGEELFQPTVKLRMEHGFRAMGPADYRLVVDSLVSRVDIGFYERHLHCMKRATGGARRSDVFLRNAGTPAPSRLTRMGTIRKALTPWKK